jgi:hypothetical protein
VKPTPNQQAALVLAVAEGYLNPGSATHARRLGTSGGQLSRTCKACAVRGWMRPIGLGRYQVTDAGMEHVPSTTVPRSDGVEWARF